MAQAQLKKLVALRTKNERERERRRWWEAFDRMMCSDSHQSDKVSVSSWATGGAPIGGGSMISPRHVGHW